VFIAMNRFQVVPEREADFERIWKERETYLQEVPGFVAFALLRGDRPGDYISHSTWQDRDAFLGWTRSESFVKGHRQAGSLQGVLAGPPELTTYLAVLHETPETRMVDESAPEPGRQGVAMSH
jgi:heme-degrading monooxygenase HmoA